MSTETTPFVEFDDDNVPRVVSKIKIGRCYGSSVENEGRCDTMDLTFEDIDEWEEHRSKFHPVSCSKHGCRIVASYKRMQSPHSYCPDHTEEAFDPGDGVYEWIRTNEEAIVETPKLPGEHPIESALQGLGV